MILRVLFFVALLAATAFVPIGFLIVCMCAYAFTYTAYELIFLAMVIDGLYGASGDMFMVPYYAIGTIFGLVIIEWIKPHLSVYNQ